MKRPIDWEEVGFAAFCIGAFTALFALIGLLVVFVLIYAPASLKSKIRLNNAKAKALEGLDLRDQETRRVLRKLFAGENK